MAGCELVDLLEIVDHAVHQPLRANLVFAPECKTVQPNSAADVGKDRFHRAQPFTIKISAYHRIDLTFHLLGKGVLAFFRPPMKISNLADFGYLRFTQTLCS